MKGWLSAILLLSGFAFAGVLWGQSGDEGGFADGSSQDWRDHPAARPSRYTPLRSPYQAPLNQTPSNQGRAASPGSIRRVQWSEAEGRVGGSGLRHPSPGTVFAPPRIGEPKNSPYDYPDTARQVDRRPARSGSMAPQQPYQRRQPPRRGTPAQAGPLEPIQGSWIIARVGRDIILASEVIGSVDAILAPYLEKFEAARGTMTENQYQEQKNLLAAQRDKLIRQLLDQLIETKLIYADARRTVPPEGMEKLQSQISEEFEKRGIKNLMERMGVRSRVELDAALRNSGTSLAASKRAYVESQVTRMWMRREANVEKTVSNAELLSYYELHGSDFDNTGRARWQQLSIRFESTIGKDNAYRQVARLGNRVLRGESFEAVAEDGSQGFTADEGGIFDWTNQGSLSSKPLDEAIFALRVGPLSRIIEDDKGFHIIRVLERQDARRTPFSAAQEKIRETIVQTRRQEALLAFRKRIRQGASIWTVYDEQDRQQPQLGERPNSRPTDRFSR